MSAGDEKRGPTVPTGFAGLSGMLSHVEDTIANARQGVKSPAPSPLPVEPKAGAGLATPHGVSLAQKPASTPSAHADRSPDPRSGGTHLGLWIAAVIGILWGFAVLVGKGNSDSSQPAAEPFVEHRPEPGDGRVLTRAELRYCAAERVRLDAAEGVVSSRSSVDVGLYNQTVDDFNSRCGSIRYREDNWSLVQKDIELMRADLEAAGRARFLRPSVRAGVANVEKEAKSAQQLDPLVQAIQARLNELGYHAGIADGLLGAQTRQAIRSFQGDFALTKDGRPSSELLEWLNAAPTRVKPNQTGATRHSDTSSSPLPTTVSAKSADSDGRSSGRPELGGLNAFERQTSERACESSKVLGASNYYNCLQTEREALSRRSGKPDLSGLGDFERQTAEQACDSSKVLGPSNYYDCLAKEVQALSRFSRKPDLSTLDAFERKTAQRSCDSSKVLGASNYYDCLQRELDALQRFSGKPDLSQMNEFERTTAERSCDSSKVLGASNYYDCLQREIKALSVFSAKPDLSALSSFERQATERACESSKVLGASNYYACLQRELDQLKQFSRR